MGLPDVISARLAESRAIAAPGREEQRAIGGVPWRPWDNPYWRFDVGGPVHPSRQVAGMASQDAALRLAAVYTSIKFLAEGVSMLPIEQYRDLGDDQVKMPLGQLLSRPSAYLNRFDWLFQYVSSAGLHGTAWGLITARDAYGFPTTVEWLPPEDVTVTDPKPYNPAKVKIFFAGRLMNMQDLLIVRAFTVAGQTAGVSPMKTFQGLIESGLAALEFGDGWYRSGGVPPGTFQNTAYEVTDEQSATVRRKLMDAQRKHEPLVYGRDWEYKPITIPPNEAQFIESMQLNATQIASIYGVSARRVGGMSADSMTYSNAEMDMIAEQTDAIDPWLCRLETALEDCLPGRQYARFDRDARLRMTTETRFQVYTQARDIGVMNVDEIRKREHMPTLPKPSKQGDYDGADYTPLQIMVAAARGANVLLGEGATGEEPGDAKGAQQQGQQKPVQPQLPGLNLAPMPVTAANGNGNGNGTAHS